MDVLLIVSREAAAPILKPLADALTRSGARWAAFFTNDGVRVLRDAAIASAVGQARTAIACHKSWEAQVGGEACPVELGSQTNNSALVGEADRVVSL